MQTPGHPRRRQGFTLLELIVVVGVIGILVALLFPAVNAARTKARERERDATKTALANAIIAYRAANGQWPVSDANIQNYGGTLTVAQHSTLVGLLNAPSPSGAPFWEGQGIVTNLVTKTPFSISIDTTNVTVTVN
jgi:prepilin-type N-terminal cleavage/methylation domain-containing protein